VGFPAKNKPEHLWHQRVLAGITSLILQLVVRTAAHIVRSSGRTNSCESAVEHTLAFVALAPIYLGHLDPSHVMLKRPVEVTPCNAFQNVSQLTLGTQKRRISLLHIDSATKPPITRRNKS
jgi:hypothetical protein